MKIRAKFAGVDGTQARREHFVIRRNVEPSRIKDFGLTLEKARASSGMSKSNRRSFRPSNAAFATLSGARAHDPRRDGRAFLPAYEPRDVSGIRLPR